MSGQAFVTLALVAALLTLVPLLWGLNLVKQRSSRLVALRLMGWTVGGVLVLLLFTRLAIGFLEAPA